jgi:hypothetical protein
MQYIISRVNNQHCVEIQQLSTEEPLWGLFPGHRAWAQLSYVQQMLYIWSSPYLRMRIKSYVIVSYIISMPRKIQEGQRTKCNKGHYGCLWLFFIKLKFVVVNSEVLQIFTNICTLILHWRTGCLFAPLVCHLIKFEGKMCHKMPMQTWSCSSHIKAVIKKVLREIMILLTLKNPVTMDRDFCTTDYGQWNSKLCQQCNLGMIAWG